MTPDGMIGCGQYDDVPIKHNYDWAGGMMAEILARLSCLSHAGDHLASITDRRL